MLVSLQINTSMILLPEMMRKESLMLVWVFFYDIFEEESQKSETKVFAVRWRLEPKSAEDAQNKKGRID
jgi:hypothetical protein